jgi:hypothetical protein
MTSFPAFGVSVEPDFVGDFENASIKVNVFMRPRPPTIYPSSREGACEVGWTFESSGGERSVFAHYASEAELSCQLIVNGDVVQSHALFEPTATLSNFDWRYQATVQLRSGQNTIVIRRPRKFPLLRAIAVAAPLASKQPTVDEYFDHLTMEKSADTTKSPFMIEPHLFAGLVLSMRGMVADDAAIRQLSSIVSHAVRSGQKNTVNGQGWFKWGGPLNGQRFRQRIFERLMRLGVDVIFETGTYLGTSTAYFARQGVPVFSCELDENTFAAAIVQLVDYKDVKIYLQDSRSFLKSLSKERINDFSFPLFYLDAHGKGDLPIADEIRIIQANWPQFVIMVDDFEVPAADGYGFDRYRSGQELTVNYLRDAGIDFGSLAVLFPTAVPNAETGVRRGTLVLTTPDLYERNLSKERLLFRSFPDRGAG